MNTQKMQGNQSTANWLTIPNRLAPLNLANQRLDNQANMVLQESSLGKIEQFLNELENEKDCLSLEKLEDYRERLENLESFFLKERKKKSQDVTLVNASAKLDESHELLHKLIKNTAKSQLEGSKESGSFVLKLATGLHQAVSKLSNFFSQKPNATQSDGDDDEIVDPTFSDVLHELYEIRSGLRRLRDQSYLLVITQKGNPQKKSVIDSTREPLEQLRGRLLALDSERLDNAQKFLGDGSSTDARGQAVLSAIMEDCFEQLRTIELLELQ